MVVSRRRVRMTHALEDGQLALKFVSTYERLAAMPNESRQTPVMRMARVPWTRQRPHVMVRF